ncbi:MAG: hypothetical protein IGS50_12535 [Synechococcales cyanobacterium C42_A2020_086]|nr:hypothetical protein [Synechococcales cyanobacterium C42_A2020_086]
MTAVPLPTIYPYPNGRSHPNFLTFPKPLPACGSRLPVISSGKTAVSTQTARQSQPRQPTDLASPAQTPRLSLRPGRSTCLNFAKWRATTKT